MKDAYAAWAAEYFDGLRIEANDSPTDMENRRTVVIFAELVDGKVPKPNEVVYFEAEAALNEAKFIGGDVHLYLFDTLPRSEHEALANLDTARYRLACRTAGVEEGQGSIEVNAQWHILDRRHPKLERAPARFRPSTRHNVHQVRAEVVRQLVEPIAYSFESGRKNWKAVLDMESPQSVTREEADALKVDRRRRTEEGEWYPVRNLVPAEAPVSKQLALALKDSAPGSGSFILVAPRRRRR
jgi:hypothetical protein